MSKALAVLILLALGCVLAFIIAMIMALPVMWLWNYAAVDVFHAPVIDFWHAFGLNFLCGLLIRSSSASSSSK